MSIINNNNDNVNQLREDFLDFVKEESNKVDEVQYFLSLIPAMQMSPVAWKIQKQFGGNTAKYVSYHRLFAECFTKEMKSMCDENLELRGTQKRSNKKKKKEYSLYSSQLLGLVGKGGSNYVNPSLLEMYDSDLEEQQQFLDNLRLIATSGQIVRLGSVAEKERRRQAQIYSVASAISLIAKDRGWTWMMLTLTLPPEYHVNPTKGRKSFNGVLPGAAHGHIVRYWQSIRSHLYKAGLRAGVDFMGVGVPEGHKDSTIHEHIMMFFSKEHKQLIVDVINNVERLERNKQEVLSNRFGRFSDKVTRYDERIEKKVAKLEKRRANNRKRNLAVDEKLERDIGEIQNRRDERFAKVSKIKSRLDCEKAKELNINFHISHCNERLKNPAQGATYLFKYMNKTLSNGNDVAKKNSALRWLYSARAFHFFGVESSISKFQFLCQNREKYEKFFSMELNACLKMFDFYTFLKVYEKFFKVHRAKGQIAFVVYDLTGNNEGAFPMKNIFLNLHQAVVIKKDVRCIFEVTENVLNEESAARIDARKANIRRLDEKDISNAGAFKAYENVKEKAIQYRSMIDVFKVTNTEYEFISNPSQIRFEDVSFALELVDDEEKKNSKTIEL